MPAPLLIADVPWLLYRSFFALPRSIKGADGRPVNALLGTVNAILSITGPPRAVVACTGAEEATYRVGLYPPYHAHRDPMPDDLRHQWNRAPALLRSLGFLHADGGALEADDVMLSYALAEADRGGRALLLTGDRDLFAAVGDSVAVAELTRGGHSEIGPAEVQERYGVAPAQVPDFIALRGDPSDGLPGAPGIGAKTAAALLREHGTLEDLLAAAETGEGIRPRVAAALTENAALLATFKDIATMRRLPVTPPPDRAPDYAAGARAASELGMARLATRLQELAAGAG